MQRSVWDSHICFDCIEEVDEVPSVYSLVTVFGSLRMLSVFRPIYDLDGRVKTSSACQDVPALSHGTFLN